MVRGLIGRGSDVVQRRGGAPRASILPIRRTAAADYMVVPALVQKPKRVERYPLGWRVFRACFLAIFIVRQNLDPTFGLLRVWCLLLFLAQWK